MDVVKVIHQEERADRLVVWHDGHLQDRRMVSPVELRIPEGGGVDGALEAALANMVLPPEPAEGEQRIAELEAENTNLRLDLAMARRGI